MINEEYKTPWTNLTECGSYSIKAFLPNDAIPDIDPLYAKWLPVIEKLTYFGSTISIIALLLSVTIFVKIKYVYSNGLERFVQNVILVQLVINNLSSFSVD